MKKVSILAAFAFLLGALAFVAMPPTSVSAADDKQPEVKVEDKEAQTEAKAYQYVAHDGDAYIQMARKAVQTYGIENEVELSQAQIVFAETELANAASFPVLNEGETVTISEDAVKSVVEKAKKLTDDQQAAWAYYVPMIDFNTDNIGE